MPDPERGSGADTLLPDRETWQSIDDMFASDAERVEQLALKQINQEPTFLRFCLARLHLTSSDCLTQPEPFFVVQGSALVSSIDPAKPLP